MIFYDTPDPAPNPQRVRLFLAEKGIEIPTETISIRDREHRAAAYLKINPLGQTPALKLDNGDVLTESVSICRYLEALHPEPPLFGRTPEEIGMIDMMIRRAELRLMMPVGMVWLHTHPFTAKLVVPQYKEFGETQRARAIAEMRTFDALLGERDYLAGNAFSMADIVLRSAIDFADFIGLPMPDDTPNLHAWHTRVRDRQKVPA